MPTGRKPGRVAGRIYRSLDDYATQRAGRSLSRQRRIRGPTALLGPRVVRSRASYHLGRSPTIPCGSSKGRHAGRRGPERERLRPSAESGSPPSGADYFEAGTRLVWDVDPIAECVHMLSGRRPINRRPSAAGDIIDAGTPVVPRLASRCGLDLRLMSAWSRARPPGREHPTDESHRHHRAGRARGPGGPRGPDARAAGRPGPGPGAGVRAEPGRPDAGRGATTPRRRGRRPTSPGLEYAGEVDALGPGRDRAAPGRRPGLRDRRRRRAGRVRRDPRADGRADPGRTSTSSEAAAVPEVFITAHDALKTQGRLEPGRAGPDPRRRQRGRHGGRPARPRDGLHRLRHLADRRRSSSRPAELGLDVGDRHVGRGLRRGRPRPDRRARGSTSCSTSSAPRRWRATSRRWRPAGRLVLVGLLGGGTGDARPLGAPARSGSRVVGTTLRARPLEEKIAATRRFADAGRPLAGARARPSGRRPGLRLRGRPRGAGSGSNPTSASARSSSGSEPAVVVGLELAVLDLQDEVVGRDEPAVVGDDDQGRLPLALEPAEDPVDLVAGLASRARRSARRPGRGPGP